jgi:hypothetical protein
MARLSLISLIAIFSALDIMQTFNQLLAIGPTVHHDISAALKTGMAEVLGSMARDKEAA